MGRGSGRLGDFFTDKRGVSTQIGYVLTAAVAAILVGVLVSSVTGFVVDQQENAARQEMKVVGQRLVAQMQAADRIAQSNPGADMRLETDTPTYVAGQRYSITVHSGPNPTDDYLVLETQSGETSVRVEMSVQTDMDETTVSGGDLDIVYTGPGGDITIERNTS